MPLLTYNKRNSYSETLILPNILQDTLVRKRKCNFFSALKIINFILIKKMFTFILKTTCYFLQVYILVLHLQKTCQGSSSTSTKCTGTISSNPQIHYYIVKIKTSRSFEALANFWLQNIISQQTVLFNPNRLRFTPLIRYVFSYKNSLIMVSINLARPS